ncbi:MAG: ComEC/Rec2 family competence protein [Chloroflexi bacterium]|nr:ComEC/Rec2 family competence protein [Chloroflexota bacterium]
MKKFIRLLTVISLILALLTSSACNQILSTSTNSTPSTNSPITTTSQGTTTQESLLEVYFLDVGQGDCEIVRYQDATMLIDAGTNASATLLVSTIKSMGISKFDVAVGTHPHEDHIGGLDAVINNFSIGKLYMPKVTTTTKTYTDVLAAIKDKGYTVTTPISGSTFNLGDAQCTILAPNSQNYEDMNNYSIVIKVTYGTTSFLFTGDAQALSEEEMLAEGYNLKADVLKIGHHGSDSSTTPQFLKAVSPQYGVIEVGKGNDYGHPHQTTLDKLAAANIKVYRTDLNGTIIFRCDGSRLTVTTAR